MITIKALQVHYTNKTCVNTTWSRDENIGVMMVVSVSLTYVRVYKDIRTMSYKCTNFYHLICTYIRTYVQYTHT